jgi:NAD+ synthase
MGEQNFRVSRVVAGNLKARIRMCFLYSVANENNLVVAGTGDRSESLIGYFTKYGDGGADIFPIAHLYKTEVRVLADYLGVPHGVVTKPSSPNLWEGHKAIDEIPAEYDVMDRALVQLFDEGKSREIVSKNTGLSLEKISEIVSRNERSLHKREPPRSMER